MFYVYILQSFKDKKYYIGSTNDIKRRLEQHNSGHTKSLKYRMPLRLAYQEEFITRTEAVSREKQIKSYKGGNAFKNLLMGP